MLCLPNQFYFICHLFIIYTRSCLFAVKKIFYVKSIYATIVHQCVIQYYRFHSHKKEEAERRMQIRVSFTVPTIMYLFQGLFRFNWGGAISRWSIQMLQYLSLLCSHSPVVVQTQLSIYNSSRTNRLHNDQSQKRVGQIKYETSERVGPIKNEIFPTSPRRGWAEVVKLKKWSN